jgi:hypothetical protein
MDARNSTESSRVYIFAREDKERVATMLHRHLRWWEGPEDNLVSWTSSLLFALVYIFHLHANRRDGSAFDDISLCITDTTKFPNGVFLRDMDLIEAYQSFDNALQDFKGLRLKKDWYFGEYLSQGASKIEGKYQIVSAQAMINEGLYRVRREFEDFAQWEPSRTPPWARPVVELRKGLYRIGSPGLGEEELRVAVSIAQLFGSPFKLPVAASLVALLAGRKEDTVVAHAFRTSLFTGLLLA